MASQRDLDHQFRMRVLEIVQGGLKWVGVVLCFALVCGFGYLSLRELAGRQTAADIAFRFFADMKANKPIALVLSWVLTAAFGTWGSGERFARRRYIKKWHPIVEEYQHSLDAKRGSSSLTKAGTTRPGDA